MLNDEVSMNIHYKAVSGKSFVNRILYLIGVIPLKYIILSIYSKMFSRNENNANLYFLDKTKYKAQISSQEKELEYLFNSLKEHAAYKAAQYKKIESIVYQKIQEVGGENELFELLHEIDKKRKN